MLNISAAVKERSFVNNDACNFSSSFLTTNVTVVDDDDNVIIP